MAKRLALASWSLALLAALTAAQAHAAPDPLAHEGVLDLRGRDLALTGPVELAGEWGFVWQRFIDPRSSDSVAARTNAFAPVPGSWKDLTAGGKAAGADGYASYTLQVQCDPGQLLALLVPAQRTAQRLYVNGRLVTQQGEPGPTAATAFGAVQRRADATPAFACPLDIVMHISSYEHRAGGFVRGLIAGPEKQIVELREQRLSLDTGLLGAFFVMGMIPILFFAARPRDTTPLVFGLFCLAMAIYADLTGERALLQLWASETRWDTYLRIEYLSWFATQALFALFAQKLFEREFHKLAIRLVLTGCALAAAVVLVTPARTFSLLAPAGQAMSVAICVYTAVIVARAARRRRVGAAAFLVGMAFLVLIVLLDALQYNRGQSTIAFTPIGLLLFVMAPAVALARRLARALNAEELRALEQREKANLLVRTTKAGIYDFDATREMASWSARLKEMLGFPQEADTSGWKPFIELVHAADRPAVQAQLARQMQRGDLASAEVRHPAFECRLARADGSWLWVLGEAISLTGADRKPLRYICSFIDISERRAMEDSLRASNEQIAAQAAQLERQNRALEESAALLRHHLDQVKMRQHGNTTE